MITIRIQTMVMLFPPFVPVRQSAFAALRSGAVGCCASLPPTLQLKNNAFAIGRGWRRASLDSRG